MRRRAIILGAVRGSGNIGDGVRVALTEPGEFGVYDHWEVKCHSCEVYSEPGRYEIPDLLAYYPDEPPDDAYEEADALIVTLGKASVLDLEELTEDEVEDLIRANLTLPLLAVRKYVKARGDAGGRIVLVGSYAHDHVLSASCAYCAAKAGIDMASKALAWDLTPRGYRVYAVHPYHVPRTPMWEKVQEGVMNSKNMTREEADQYAYKDARMELMKPVEVGRIVRMLLEQPEAAWMSGSSVTLYGGTR